MEVETFIAPWPVVRKLQFWHQWVLKAVRSESQSFGVSKSEQI